MRYIFFVIVLSLSMVLFSSCNKKVDRPNIVIIMMDDMGWGDMGLHGNRKLKTTLLDILAKKSVEFNRFYVSPYGASTRATVLTGKYPLNTGVSWISNRKEVIPAEEEILPELLKPYGYTSGFFGKWSNGIQYPNDPLGQGFDEFFGFKGDHLSNYFGSKAFHNLEEVDTRGYFTDVIIEKAIEFINTKKDEPFLCFLSLNTPHKPFQVDDNFYEKYSARDMGAENTTVYGMIEHIDLKIMEVLNALETIGKSNNTILIFMSDNGPNTVRYNGAMKGIKGSVDEGGVRVPFFIRYPKENIGNKKIKEGFATDLDILPTLLDLCDIPLSEKFDGVSLVNTLKYDKPLPDRLFFTHQPKSELTKIPGAVRTQNYLLTISSEDTLLYDLKADPMQHRDIKELHQDVVHKWLAEYDSWINNLIAEGITPPLIPVGYDNINEIELPAQEGILSDSLNFMGKMGLANDYVIGFKSDSDVVRFDLDVVDKGEFELFVKLSALHTGDDTQIKIKSNDLIITKNLSDAKANRIYGPDRAGRDDVFEKDWPLISIGTLEFNQGEESISISFSGLESSTEIEFKSLHLVKK